MSENIQGSMISIHPMTRDLPTLSAECRILIRMREDVRLALALRVVLVSKIFAEPPYNEPEGKGGLHREKGRGGLPRKQFWSWCAQNLKTRDGKIYSKSGVESLLVVGRKGDPEKYLAAERERALMHNRSKATPERKAGTTVLRALSAAVESTDALPRVPLTVPPYAAESTPGYSDEVNAMVAAWEQARPQARAQFLSIIGACYQRRAAG